MRRSPRLRHAAFLAGTVVALSSTAIAALSAQEEAARDEHADSFTLPGVVLDEERGTPVVGAAVGGPDGQVVFTDARGRFRLFDVPPGWVTFQVQQLGYVDLTADAEVSPGDTLEVRLVPHPVRMEEIEVVVDRFERRRNAYPFPVRVLAQRELMTSAASSVLDFVGSRAGLHIYPCPSGGQMCIWRRGGLVRPTVYVDEVRWAGGLDALRGYQPHQIYMIEVLNRGLQVRVYTTYFMERAARRGLRPLPIL